MKYYLFRVKDSLGEEYYILNNQYIGYVGFDSEQIRSALEYQNKVTKKYQLFAESDYIPDGSTIDTTLHRLNCASNRFTKEEAEQLVAGKAGFQRKKDRAWYRVYYPSRNSSASYLKEIGGAKVIK